MSEQEIPNRDQAEPPQLKERSPMTKKQWRNWWIKTALMLLLIGISIVIMFTIGEYVTGDEAEQISFPTLLRQIDYRFFALLLGVLLLYILIESSKYAYLLKITTGKFYFRTSVKTMLIGKYYDGITPLSTGGQPFQIHYLHSKDIPNGIASALPLVRYIVSAIVISIVSIVLLCLTNRFVESSIVSVTMLIVAAISLVINAAVPVAVILFSVFPKSIMKIVVWGISFLNKIHIVKNKYAVSKRCINGLLECSAAMKLFGKKIKYILPLLVLCLAEVVFNYSIPFFTVIAVAQVTPSVELFCQILCLSMLTRYTALLLPTPGNTGAMEATGSLAFATVAGIEPVIGWVVLIWRLFTYYIYILCGIGINIFDLVRGSIRQRRKTSANNKTK